MTNHRSNSIANVRTLALSARIKAGRSDARQFSLPIRHFTSRTTMTQTTPAPAAPIPTSAKDMTPQQYAAARAEIRRGNLPTYQPAQGAK